MQTQAISFLQSLPANIVNEMNPQVYYTFILKESIEDRNCMPEDNPNTTYTKKLDRIRIFNLKKLWNLQTY